MNQAISQIDNYFKNEPNESRVVLLFTEGYTPDQIKEFTEEIKNRGGIVQSVVTATAVTNYINSKKTYSGDVDEVRSSDKVTNVDAFAHGLPSSIEFGYKTDNADAARFGVTQSNSLKPEAFADGATFTSYACRTGASTDLLRYNPFNTPGDAKSESSLAQKMANSADINVDAFISRTDYSGTLGTRMDRKLESLMNVGVGTKRTENYTALHNFKAFQKQTYDVDGGTFSPAGAYRPVTSSGTPINTIERKIFTPEKKPQK